MDHSPARPRPRIFSLVMLAMMLAALWSGCSSSSDSPTDPDYDYPMPMGWVALFNGRGAWLDGVIALQETLNEMGYEWRTVDMNGINQEQLTGAWLIIMPGGNAGWYSADISSAGAAALRNRIAHGMGYVGVCAGAFFAAENVSWMGRGLNYPLDVFPGAAIGPLPEITPPGSSAVTTISLTEHGANDGRSGKRKAYYFDGPRLEGGETLANYPEAIGAAAVTAHYGEGVLILSGVHPEMREETKPLLKGWLHYILLSQPAPTGGAQPKQLFSAPRKLHPQLIQPR